jgi:hypothetical protein
MREERGASASAQGDCGPGPLILHDGCFYPELFVLASGLDMYVFSENLTLVLAFSNRST